MPSFPETIRAQLRGATVRAADLLRFDFKSGEQRLWSGFGLLKDNNGEVWTGAAGMGEVGAVSSGPGQAIEELVMVLFADMDMLVHVQSDTGETYDRDVRRYAQFFDVRKFDEQGRWVEWQPLDVPFQLFRGKMSAPQVNSPRRQVGEAAPRQRTVTVRAANAFLNRRRPSFGYYSHRDQQGRTGGTDNMFIRASEMADTVVRWPDL